MGEVLLTIAGGAACMTLMGVGVWLVPRLVRRNRLLRSTLARLRWRTTFGRIVSWVEAERPDLRRASAPDGTVTLLFSDIENSSRLTERLGDQRWLEVLNAHNTIVRAQLDEHGGYEVKSQGDGFMLAFPSPPEAGGRPGCAPGLEPPTEPGRETTSSRPCAPGRAPRGRAPQHPDGRNTRPSTRRQPP